MYEKERVVLRVRQRPLSLTWKPIKMAEVLQMFLFLYKSKYRRKNNKRIFHDREDSDFSRGFIWSVLIWAVVLRGVAAAASTTSTSTSTEVPCDIENCVNGDCVNGSCICQDGWQGAACQYCGGKVRYVNFSLLLSQPNACKPFNIIQSISVRGEKMPRHDVARSTAPNALFSFFLPFFLWHCYASALLFPSTGGKCISFFFHLKRCKLPSQKNMLFVNRNVLLVFNTFTRMF